MKKNDINWISWLALALSIAACIITWLRVEIYTTNDTFVGVMAGFMGASATIIVGVQIFNSIETKREINELKKSYEIKISNIEKVQEQLKEELKTSQNTREYGENFTKYGVNYAIASSNEDTHTIFAFSMYHKALIAALELHDTSFINNSLTQLEKVSDILIEKEISIPPEKKKSHFSIEKLKEYKEFPLLKNRYQKICNKLKI